MPFYEYECTACKFYVEVLQKISEAPLRKCPSCKKSKLKKLVSAPNFRLKGAGWYETDFKSDKEEKRNLADREEASESKGGESKPRAAADSSKDKDAGKTEAKPTGDKAASSAKRADSRATPSKARPAPKPKAPVKPVARSKPRPKPKAKAKPAAKKKSRR